MRIFIKAKPKSKTEYIKKLDSRYFEIAVKEPPKEDKANQAFAKALAVFFNVPLDQVELVSGRSYKQKVFEVPLTEEELEKIITEPEQQKLI